ncbi:MAG: YggT family protein [Candidatus Gastranaerophilaceae bacterium]
MTPQIAIKIIEAIANCFYVYIWMIIVRCLLTWIPNLNWENFILKLLKESVDLYLDLFRKFIPPVGMFDLSPMVAVVVLYILRNIILHGAIYLFVLLGFLE